MVRRQQTADTIERRPCAFCGTECTTHPDAANPLAPCQDCGAVTCLDHRVEDEADRCVRCAAVHYAAHPAGCPCPECFDDGRDYSSDTGEDDLHEDYLGQRITGPDFDTRDREGDEPRLPLRPCAWCALRYSVADSDARTAPERAKYCGKVCAAKARVARRAPAR